MTMKNKNI